MEKARRAKAEKHDNKRRGQRGKSKENDEHTS